VGVLILVGNSRCHYPRLTTIDYPLSDTGRTAAQEVLENAYGKSQFEIQQVFHSKLKSRWTGGPAAVQGEPFSAAAGRRHQPSRSHGRRSFRPGEMS
jgi:hypothetical protein